MTIDTKKLREGSEELADVYVSPCRNKNSLRNALIRAYKTRGDTYYPILNRDIDTIATQFLAQQAKIGELEEENERLRKAKKLKIEKGKLQYPHDDLRFKVHDRPERRRG